MTDSQWTHMNSTQGWCSPARRCSEIRRTMNTCTTCGSSQHTDHALRSGGGLDAATPKVVTETHGREVWVYVDDVLAGFVSDVGKACAECGATYLASRHDSYTLGCVRSEAEGIQRVVAQRPSPGVT